MDIVHTFNFYSTSSYIKPNYIVISTTFPHIHHDILHDIILYVLVYICWFLEPLYCLSKLIRYQTR